jgi:hypothetical protein
MNFYNFVYTNTEETTALLQFLPFQRNKKRTELYEHLAFSTAAIKK